MSKKNAATKKDNVTRAEDILIKIGTILMVLAFALSVVVDPALAYSGDDPAPGDDGVSTMLAMLTKLAQIFINAAYSLMFIVFAVGTVKGGLGAQVAQAAGLAPHVSMNLMNIVGGLIVFVFGLMTLPLVNYIISNLGSLIPTDLSINVPVIGG